MYQSMLPHTSPLTSLWLAKPILQHCGPYDYCPDWCKQRMCSNDGDPEGTCRSECGYDENCGPGGIERDIELSKECPKCEQPIMDCRKVWFRPPVAEMGPLLT